MFKSVGSSRAWRRATSALLAVAMLCAQPTPAAAWKPKTHVYLAEAARRDAIDDGKVTIYETDYETGKIIGPLGSFEVNPAILAALREKPEQFRAGVIGPDAYPDILTGQQTIHPGTNLALLGHPSSGEAPSAPGADAWLTYLWRNAYGRRDPALDAALARIPLFKVRRSDTPEVRAFVIGYLTHAAGDMFMHTFVNHYAGGDFALKPDPMNAVKHVVLEGYVGERTPDVRAKVSIEGVEHFIWSQMVTAERGSVLDERLLRGAGASTSVPSIFSKLRNGLQRDVDAYERERLSRSGPSRVAYASLNGPLVKYKIDWINDIDRGLEAWPKISHDVALALVYSETDGGADMGAAREIMNKGLTDHLASMAGVPDAAIVSLSFLGQIISGILPPPLDQVLHELKRMPLDWLIKEATGKTPEVWAGYLMEPAKKFDEVMNGPGGGYGGRIPTRTTLAAFNKEVLRIDDPAARYPDRRFRIDDFPPAFNTVQMTKLAFLSEKGMNDLLAVLKSKGVNVPPLPTAPGRYENAMLGFLSSMDADNQWHALGGAGAKPNKASFFLARGDAGGWRKLFLKQLGERPGWTRDTAPVTDPTPGAPDDTGFQTIEKWGVRVDKVEYGAANGGTGTDVVVTATLRNDRPDAVRFNEKLLRTLLNRKNGGTVAPIRMEYVHPDAASLPAWHYLPGTDIARKGRISVRYIYSVGKPANQAEVHGWTVFEQAVQPGLLPLKYKDGASKTFPLTPMPAPTPTAADTRAPAPKATADVDALKTLASLEGVYRTNRTSLLTLKVEGGFLVGRAVNDGVPRNQREQLKLALAPDGSLRGEWREEQRAGVWTDIDLTLRFTADGLRFSGEGKYTFAPGNPPLQYSGERLVDDKSGGAAADGFKPVGYFLARLDSVGRQGGKAGAPVDVTFTFRSEEERRRGLWYDDCTWTLIGSDGQSYKTDGNAYGKSGLEPMKSTVWMEKGVSALRTFVFAKVPADVKPAKLVVRDYYGKVIAEYDLANLDGAGKG